MVEPEVEKPSSAGRTPAQRIKRLANCEAAIHGLLAFLDSMPMDDQCRLSLRRIIAEFEENRPT